MVLDEECRRVLYTCSRGIVDIVIVTRRSIRKLPGIAIYRDIGTIVVNDRAGSGFFFFLIPTILVSQANETDIAFKGLTVTDGIRNLDVSDNVLGTIDNDNPVDDGWIASANVTVFEGIAINLSIAHTFKEEVCKWDTFKIASCDFSWLGVLKDRAAGNYLSTDQSTFCIWVGCKIGLP